VSTRSYQIEQVLFKCMEEVAAQTGNDLVADLNPTTNLQESGLDGLGLAMVVGRMDEALGYSPFRDGSCGELPHTLAELVSLYRHADDDR